MAPIRKVKTPGRNETCPCGSGQKFKRCHGFDPGREPAPAARGVSYIDTGEDAIRWVICDRKGTSFFSDKDNRILVFADKAVALAVAGLEEFSDRDDGEINVAGVGPTKFAHLCEKLPYIEVSEIETAVALVRERIEVRSQPAPENTTSEENTNAGS